MRIRGLLLGVCAALWLAGCAASSGPMSEDTGPKIHSLKNGVVAIEAESAEDLALGPEAWELVKEPEGYSGEGYLVWRGEAVYGEGQPHAFFAEDPDRVLTYHVRIEEPGTYWAKVKNLHHREDGDNDVWVSIAGNDWVKTYDHQEEEFTFDETGEWSQREISEPGVYPVQLAGRSWGFGADYIVVFKVGTPDEVWMVAKPGM